MAPSTNAHSFNVVSIDLRRQEEQSLIQHCKPESCMWVFSFKCQHLGNQKESESSTWQIDSDHNGINHSWKLDLAMLLGPELWPNSYFLYIWSPWWTLHSFNSDNFVCVVPAMSSPQPPSKTQGISSTQTSYCFSIRSFHILFLFNSHRCPDSPTIILLRCWSCSMLKQCHMKIKCSNKTY